jgi:Flp pilus assembly protein TadD
MSEEPVRRLEGWKVIADHLGRSSRTVQRWHRFYKLPVRHVGGSGGGVFAYTDEIDEWFRHADPTMGADSETDSRGTLIAMPVRSTGNASVWLNPGLPLCLSDRSLARERVDDGYHLWRMLSRNNLRSVVQAFREAIDLDPQNPEGYAGLSHALIAQGMIGSLRLSSAYSSARVALETALRLDGASTDAKCALAWLRMVSERNWEGAESLFDHLLENGPISTRMTVGRGLLYVAQRQLDTASHLLYGASQSDPLSSLWLGLHAWSEYLAGKFTEVMEHIMEAHESARHSPFLVGVEALTASRLEQPSDSIAHIEMLLADDPGNSLARGALGYIAGRSGDKRKARAVLDDLSCHHSHAQVTPHYAMGLVHIGLEQTEQAIRSLLLSYEEGSLWSLGFAVDPACLTLANEPAYRDFVRSAFPPPALHTNRPNWPRRAGPPELALPLLRED